MDGNNIFQVLSQYEFSSALSTPAIDIIGSPKISLDDRVIVPGLTEKNMLMSLLYNRFFPGRGLG